MNKPIFSTGNLAVITLIMLYLNTLLILDIGLFKLRSMPDKYIDHSTIDYWFTIIYFLKQSLILAVVLFLVLFYNKIPRNMIFCVIILFFLFLANQFQYSGKLLGDLNGELQKIIRERSSDKSSYFGPIRLIEFIFPFLLVLIPTLVAGFLRKRILFYYLLMVFICGFIQFAISANLNDIWCMKIVKSFIS